jgi:dienelactone hydrolase
MTLSLGLFLIGILGLSCLSTSIFKQQDQALAQQYVQTIKYRNLVIDLGNGLKTNATLTYPAVGKGPFPGVLILEGSGAIDKNGTVGTLHKNGPKPTTPYLQIAQYLSERGFAVLRYDKRGVGPYSRNISNSNVWGNATANDSMHDAQKALNVLIQQPEVDPKRVSLFGHSEGTIYAPRIAIDNSTKVKNIILYGIVAKNFGDVIHSQTVTLPLEYATRVLDKNHTGSISIEQIAKDPVLLGTLPIPISILRPNNTKTITNTLVREFGTNGSISIDKQLRPLLMKAYENHTALNLSKCINIEGCPIWLRSQLSLLPTLSIIGNVSKSTGILLLNGENDSQTPVQQAFLLQQRLTDVQHPDHTLITYPNLGHDFYPSSQWLTSEGPIPPYVLADIYAWLEAHSGISHPNVGTPTSTLGANSSSSGKR